jgi:hypothetical protein
LTTPSLGQERIIKHRPFSILIIAPDSATIDPSITVFADSVEKRYVNKYYDFLKAYEKTKDVGSEEQRQENALRIQEMRFQEMEIQDYKYYDLVANETYRLLEESFNMVREGPGYWHRQDIMTGEIARITELFSYDFRKLSAYLEVDYILRIENIHTIKLGEGPENISLGYTVILYAAKNDKVVLKKEIVGNSLVRVFEMRSKTNTSEDDLVDLFKTDSIYCLDFFDCMLNNAIGSATKNIYKTLSKLQRK